MAPSNTRPTNAHLVCCNGADLRGRPREWRNATRHDLWTFTLRKNVELKITDLTDRMTEELPDRILDLVEIAALLYAADQSCGRLSGTTIDYGDRWHRSFRFECVVRDPAFWRQPRVVECLSDTLAFLTDDSYEFEFTKGTTADFPMYLEFDRAAADPAPVERVVLFSGGLDSLAGAAEEIVLHKRRVALVSHKVVQHLASRQQYLFNALSEKAAARELRPLYFPMLCHRLGHREGDYTQRSRSILYAAVAFAVARYFGFEELFFYENGVVSINLPLCGQEVGSRATRTTHPKVLADFGKLFGLLAGGSFQVQNPYLWETKQDVVHRLQRALCGPLVGHSLSCSHTRQFTLANPQCGLCSQCLSRRVAVIGAALREQDPDDLYRKDVLLGARPHDADRILAERFVGQACLVETMDGLDEFHQEYAGHLGRVCSGLGLTRQAAVERVYDLHRRHAVQVGQVMHAQMVATAELRRTGNLEDTCVVNFAFDSGQTSSLSLSERRRQAEVLKDLVGRLGAPDRECIQALYARHVIGPTAEAPSQTKLAAWVGRKCDAAFKAALAALVKTGLLDNHRHHGERGGYYLTLTGEQAGGLISADWS